MSFADYGYINHDNFIYLMGDAENNLMMRNRMTLTATATIMMRRTASETTISIRLKGIIYSISQYNAGMTRKV